MGMKYVVISLGRAENKPPTDPGKTSGGESAIYIDGNYPEGYKQVDGVEGEWKPVALWVEIFRSESALNKFLDSDDGAEFKRNVKKAIQVQVADRKPATAKKSKPKAGKARAGRKAKRK